MALCLAFALGPLTGGAIIESLSFDYLMVICCVLNIIMIPFCFFLRNPPMTNRKDHRDTETQEHLIVYSFT